MLPTSPSAPPRASRPAWLLWLIALPTGLVVNGLTDGLDNLPQALMTLMGWLAEPTRLQRLSAALVGNFLVPGVIAFGVLRLTPLGRWLAPNRLAVGGLILAHGLLMFLVLHGLYQVSIDMPPYLMGTVKHIVHTATTAAVASGLGALAVSTLWHRLVRDNQRVLSVGRRLWSEYTA